LFEPTPARKRLFEIITALLDRSQKSGEIRKDIPAEDIAFQILSIYWGVILAIIAGAGDSGALLDSAWRFILGGVRDDALETRRLDAGRK
jgi:hypothetical protein